MWLYALGLLNFGPFSLFDMHKALTLFNSIRTILLLAIYGLVLSLSLIHI